MSDPALTTMSEGDMAQVNLGQIKYDARSASFEARVDVMRSGVVYRYPCRIHGPRDMPTEVVGASLARAALSMSDTSGWPDA